MYSTKLPSCQSCTSLLALLVHINQLQRVGGASVAASLKIRASAILLLTAECLKVWRWGGTDDKTSQESFVTVRALVRQERQT